MSSIMQPMSASGAITQVILQHLGAAASTVPGALALHLAGLLDAGGITASGAATLTRELSRCVEEATRTVPQPDLIDEIFARRQQKVGEAG